MRRPSRDGVAFDATSFTTCLDFTRNPTRWKCNFVCHSLSPAYSEQCVRLVSKSSLTACSKNMSTLPRTLKCVHSILNGHHVSFAKTGAFLFLALSKSSFCKCAHKYIQIHEHFAFGLLFNIDGRHLQPRGFGGITIVVSGNLSGGKTSDIAAFIKRCVIFPLRSASILTHRFVRAASDDTSYCPKGLAPPKDSVRRVPQGQSRFWRPSHGRHPRGSLTLVCFACGFHRVVGRRRIHLATFSRTLPRAAHDS